MTYKHLRRDGKDTYPIGQDVYEHLAGKTKEDFGRQNIRTQTREITI